MAVNAPYIGIDVYNGYGYINWDLVYGNIDFVMIKAGQGTGFIDPKFDYNARSCERLGIPYGVYWFSNAYTVQAAHAEAVVCVDTLLNNGNPYNPTFPVAFDWERTDAPSGTPIADMTRDFLDYVASYGFIPMVYANPALLNTALASIYANEIANGIGQTWIQIIKQQIVDGIVNGRNQHTYYAKTHDFIETLPANHCYGLIVNSL